jgi:hypothetical protein
MAGEAGGRIVKRYCSGVCQNDSPRITINYREHDSWQSARKRAIELAKPARLKREKTAYARLPTQWAGDYLWVRYFYG